MGLSASQARLLSITQRINNNELQSEMIANAKIQLSARNTVASEKYINSLDATKLEYISYNDTGIQENVALTFNAINQYTPLKNQYALFNNEGQIYVNETDKNNFESSKNLYEFLDKYGLFDEGRADFDKQLAEYDKQMDKYNNEKKIYDDALANFNKQMDDYTAKLEEYNRKLAEFNEKQRKYEEDYQKYLDALNAPDLYATFSGAVGTKDTATGSGSSFCYYYALNGDSGCYLHLLNELLDFNGSSPTSNTYTASNGQSVTTNGSTGGMGIVPELKDVSDGMNETDENGKYLRVCDGDDDLNTPGNQNLLKAAKDAGRTPTELEILKSDYLDNGDGTYSLKSLKQKAIDMYYIIQNGLVNDKATMYEMLVNFTDGDMQKLTLDPPKEPSPPEDFTEEPPEMKIPAPQEPKKPVMTDKIYDKPLAQWYTNLWNLMDGSTKSDEIYSIYDEQADFDYFTVQNKPKNSTKDNNNYVVIANELASDANWLQFVLNNGQVTMSQAALRENINGTDITWAGVESSSTSDIYESQDDTKIAKAEAEYKKTLYEIQAEDKQLDIKIKKLDTEHSALLKEVESIKGVMDKNTERSYTAFS